MHAGRYHMPAITHASSGYKSQRRDQAEKGGGENDRRKKENKGRKERGEVTVGRKKGGERAAPALPTPSSAHQLLRPAATAIIHHKHTSTAQRKGEEGRKKTRQRGKA